MSASGSDAFDALVARCLERFEIEGEPALEAICAEHPALRDRLERRVRRIVDMGVLRTTGVPRRCGPYEILYPLGAGGMGEVFLAAQDHPVRRKVALKVIRAGMESEAVVQRFHAERQALAQLNHDGIARVFDAGSTPDGRPWFAMEFVEGEPITQFAETRKLSIEARLELFLAVCAAVQHAHQNGIIHRDLKPSNILVAGDGDVHSAKVIDFGLAKATDQRLTESTLTHFGQVVGTPEYMSPEQAHPSELGIDTRTDVYSLGVILYKLVAGALPFDSDVLRQQGVLEFLDLLLHSEPLRASRRVAALDGALDGFATTCGFASHRDLQARLTGDLDWILEKALCKDKDQRYASVSEFGADVRRHLDHLPVIAGPPSTSYILRKFVRRHRGAVSAAAAIFVLLVGSLIVISSLAVASLRNLESFDLLALGDDIDRMLQTAAAERWPARPEGIAPMRRWLEDLDGLMAKAAGLREIRARLRADHGREVVTGDERTWTFDKPRFAKLHASIEASLHGMEQIDAEQGVRADVHRRLDWAGQIVAASVEKYAAEWREAIAAIEADPRYGIAGFAPQVGLVPLGVDPVSRLWEFAFLIPAGRIPRRDPAGRLEFDADTCPVLVLFPGGVATLGAQREDPTGPNYDREALVNESPIQSVPLEPFFLGKYELSGAQWTALAASDPSTDYEGRFGIDGTHPVNTMTWDEADTGLTTWGLALPTEAQWEYACRFGNPCYLGWWTGDKAPTLRGAANLSDRSYVDSGVQTKVEDVVPWDDGYVVTAPVNSLRANGAGLHHMAGNVWELCRDTYRPYADYGHQFPPRAGDGLRSVSGDTRHTIRGGSWHSGALSARSAFRFGFTSTSWAPAVGVRIARKVDRE